MSEPQAHALAERIAERLFVIDGEEGHFIELRSALLAGTRWLGGRNRGVVVSEITKILLESPDPL